MTVLTFWALLFLSGLEPTTGFQLPGVSTIQQQIRERQRVTTLYMAKKFGTTAKSGAKRKGRPSTSGFGGAASDTCPCGGGGGAAEKLPYMKCCGKLHKNILEFQKATPSQVVRARYTAYAKREIDFIIKSTHPLNKAFEADIQHWRQQIDLNCYDNFELTKCEIASEEIMDDQKTALVTFVAHMIQRDSKEKTAFQETSTFEKIGGAWLYKEGKIEEPPGREPKDDDHDAEAGDNNETAAEDVASP